MTDFCQAISMWHASPLDFLNFETLDRRDFLDPTLRFLRSLSMGLLRFSIFDAVKKSVKYSIIAFILNYLYIALLGRQYGGRYCNAHVPVGRWFAPAANSLDGG